MLVKMTNIKRNIQFGKTQGKQISPTSNVVPWEKYKTIEMVIILKIEFFR